MSFRVTLSHAAGHDLDRHEAWLAERNPNAAAKAGQLLTAAIASLDTSPLRGRNISTGIRELVVPFGSAAYLIRYRVREDAVYVTRILHSRERR